MKPQRLSKYNFKNKVLRVVSRIPWGETLTYAQVVYLAGRPKAYRAVGNILSRNFDPKVPCHRVIRSDGKIGGYNRGAGFKKRLLQSEGVIFRPVGSENGVVNR